MDRRLLRSLALVLVLSLVIAGGAAAQPDILPIGEVQGEVTDTDNGRFHSSPYENEEVTVQGVIYQLLLQRTSQGGSLHSFFIQNTDETADGDVNTSDGILVFLGSSPDIGDYTPEVGDEVVLTGTIDEFFGLTELTDVALEEILRSDVDIDAELPALEVDPPADMEDAARYWERREGMRAQVPVQSLVMNGRDVFPSSMDGELWVIRSDAEVAQRDDAYARRVFRDPHPLDNIPGELFDDGNGYRILMGSLGVKATTGDNNTLIAPGRTWDTLDNAPIGGVYYSFGKYSVQVGEQPELTVGVDPTENAPPQAAGADEYSVAAFNVENLYDYRDDPFDGCDFPGNAGCPGVNPPFDYVPADDADYQARLQDLARQILDDLHSPDIIMAQEAEEQDICTVQGGVFTCGDVNNADGRPDTLQELGTLVADLGGPSYTAAYDRDGGDDRGIVSGYLYRTDRVELLPAQASHPVLGSNPQVDYRGAQFDSNRDVQNPKTFNAVLPDDVDRSTGTDGDNVFTRAPQVALFRVWTDGVGVGDPTTLYAISNHFSSGPDSRVGQRTEQALYNAAIADALQALGENMRVVVGGDLNVFPRPDDPFAPGHDLYPSDQLGPLYEEGLVNLHDTLLDEVPASAYTYVFEGQAQTLDQIFVTPNLEEELAQVRVAHINSDWPEFYPDDGPRGTSDHDPVVARFMAAEMAPPPAGRMALAARVYLDVRCDGYFLPGVDQPLGNVPVTIAFADGSLVTGRTRPFGLVTFAGFDGADGVTLTVSIPDSYRGYSLELCPTSRGATLELDAADFPFGYNFVQFGVRVAGEQAGP